MKGFKATNEKMQCRGYQFELGKEFEIEGELKMCENGFHFCTNIVDVHNFYSLNDENTRLFEIEALGEVQGEGTEKQVTSKIVFVKEYVDEEKQAILNTGKGNTGIFNSGYWNSGDRNSGDRNSGDRNSGDRNSGNRNSGYWNSGYWNSGYWNSGDWNSCNRETGFFNSKSSETINVFNKPCKLRTWQAAIKPNFIYFDLVEWVEDTSKTEGGYLHAFSYKEAFIKSYESLKDEEREYQTKLLKALPNFDADVFYEISGIRIK
jgi:hypothetical protein